MNRAYAITMKRPHESLGIPMPIGRKLSEAGKLSWLLFVIGACVACSIVYVYQVNRAASKGYELRRLETQLERLQESVAAMDDQSAQQQTMKSLQDRVQAMGYVPVDQIDYVQTKSNSYALAH